MAQLEAIEIQLLDIELPLAWAPVAHPDIRDLRQLCKYYIPSLLVFFESPVLQQILEPLILLFEHHLLKLLVFGYFLLVLHFRIFVQVDFGRSVVSIFYFVGGHK